MAVQRRRRARGEGTVYEFRPGAWLAQVRVDGGRLSATGPSAAAAQQRLAAKVAAAAAGTTGARPTAPAPSLPTVGEHLTAWVEDLRASRARKPSAWRRYDSVVRVHLVPFLGSRRLDELSRQDVLDLLVAARRGETSGRRQADTSLHHIHAVLRNGIQHAVDVGLLAGNVVRLVDAPPMCHRDRVILSPAQAHRLIRAARGAPLEAAIVLGVATGMREGEVLGLRPEDVDLERQCLHVRKNATRDFDGRPALDDPGTARSRRRIDLPEVAVRALREHLRRLPPGSAVLFPAATGAVLSGTSFLTQHFHPVLSRAGLPRMPFRDLRHSAATILEELGVDAVTVSEILGHATPAVTMRLHRHVTPRLLRAAAVRMDTVLGRPAERLATRSRSRGALALEERLPASASSASWIPGAGDPLPAEEPGKQDGKHPALSGGGQA
jgi:integrase